MPKEVDSEPKGQELEGLQGESIVFVTPFYNEEQNIPEFFSNVSSAAKEKNIYFVGVNHRSSDKSKAVFASSAQEIGRYGIIYEPTDVPSVGIPRQKGIHHALELARQEKQLGRKVVIGSIDIDSTIPSTYFDEAKDFLLTNKDFLVFPTRYDPNTLLDCVDSQVDEEACSAALRDLIGIDWMKFNLRAFLLKAGAIETRGSGGYFFTVDGYDKAGGHKPLYSADGKLIVGESNALGIRATRAGATYEISDTVVTANPRRMLQSVLKNSQEYRIEEEGKTFDTTQNISIMPKLTSEGWNRHFASAMSGALRTFTIKGLAYGVSDSLRSYIHNSRYFNELVDKMQAKYASTVFGGDEREAIGSSVYIGIYNDALSEMGANAVHLLRSFSESLPDESSLLEWSNSKGNVRPIDKLIV